MKFDDKFLLDEVRDGFYISGRMKRCWAAQLVVLEEIDKICRRHNITYFAEFGTLLGTVRHGGYIPWDDDLDICMKREDYDRFLEIAPKELPKGYAAHTYDGEYEFWDIMCRVANTTYINLEEDFLDKHYGCPYAVGIDIFPLDYLAPDGEAEKKQYEIINYCMGIADQIRDGLLNPTEIENQVSYIEHWLGRKISRKKDVRRQLYRIAEDYFSLYSDRNSEFITQIGSKSAGVGAVYPKRYFGKKVYLNYEGFSMPVPIAYEDILRGRYGDYMRLVKSGGSHEYPCFRRQENQLIAAGYKDKRYAWTGFVRKKAVNKSNENDSGIKKQIILALNSLTAVHTQIYKAAGQGDEEGMVKLLSQCQEMAITVGTLIENTYRVAEHPTVQLLEEYCECLYNLEGFDEKLSDVITNVEENIEDLKHVVFLVTEISKWPQIDKYFEDECNQQGNIVHIIPVPYYMKGFKGDFQEAFFEFEAFNESLKELPKNSDLLLYKDYELQENHPSRIYIQNPYDEYHDTVTVMPEFFGSKLINYTDELVYVPYFDMSEAETTNERDCEAMRYYMPVPGVALADRVLLHSDKEKKLYEEYLTDWAGKDTTEYWREKLQVVNICSAENKNNTSRGKDAKKVLLFDFGTSVLTEDANKALDKLEHLVDIFITNADKLHIMWCESLREWDTEMADIQERYQKLVDRYIMSECGEYLLENSYDENIVIAEVSAYYGCAGRRAHKVRMQGKPVMICNINV